MTLIIAEAGVNHNGDLSLALELVDAASEAGADIVKFQTFKADSLTTFNAQQADYQKLNTGVNQTQYQLLKQLELKQEYHYDLIQYCQTKKIEFLSTAFDLNSIEFLSSLDPKRWKIPSGELTNLPYLRIIAAKRQPVILSTGMATLSEVGQSLDVLVRAGLPLKLITALHCTTAYPTPLDEVNLLAMTTLKKVFHVDAGYSDHTLGINVPLAAVSLGASIIEKHITLDKGMLGPDHKASLDPIEFKSMVNEIRNIEIVLGSAEKVPTKTELENIPIARKSIVAACPIKKGEILTPNNMTCKRPGLGLSPMIWDRIVGTQACADYGTNDFITI